jgi:hypothetical protein
MANPVLGDTDSQQWSDPPLAPEIVSLWIQKSKSHPLDVFTEGYWNIYEERSKAIVAMVHRALADPPPPRDC